MHYTGTATSLTELRLALFNACTANGYSLVGASNDILSKDGILVQVTLSTPGIRFRGWSAISGGVVSGGTPVVAEMRRMFTSQTLSFPVTYEIHLHADPDEVYFIVVNDVTEYLWAAFGKSDVTGLPGTGCWVSAIFTSFNLNTGISITSTGGGSLPNGVNRNVPAAPFWQTSGSAWINSHVHHDLDSSGWGVAAGEVHSSGFSSSSNQGLAVASIYASPNHERIPNSFNGESVLVPINVYASRAASKVSLVLSLRHARFTRVDNYFEGQIITLGDDTWKVYPFFKKNTSQRDGGSGIAHTGTFGWAIRYDGE